MKNGQATSMIWRKSCVWNLSHIMGHYFYNLFYHLACYVYRGVWTNLWTHVFEWCIWVSPTSYLLGIIGFIWPCNLRFMGLIWLCAQNITNSTKWEAPMYNVISWREKWKIKIPLFNFHDQICKFKWYLWWFAIANLMRQFPTRSNSQSCFVVGRVPIIGTPTLIPLVKIWGAASHNAS